MIVEMRRHHIGQVVRIHMDSLPQDFLSSLGITFLKILYRGMLDIGGAFGFVFLERNQISGFVLASADSRQLLKTVMIRNTMPLSFQVIWAAIRKPTVLLNALETFLYPRKPGSITDRAELLVIAVRAGHRGKQIGERLCHRLNVEFKRRGIFRYKVTVIAENTRANRFYQRLGFRFQHSFTLYRKRWNLYTFNII